MESDRVWLEEAAKVTQECYDELKGHVESEKANKITRSDDIITQMLCIGGGIGFLIGLVSGFAVYFLMTGV
jgi:hypothetical protein